MFTKTVAIEGRRHNVSAVSLHPGTTDTDLSKPFQGNISRDKLLPVDGSVSHMLAVIGGLSMRESGMFLSFDGSIIEY